MASCENVTSKCRKIDGESDDLLIDVLPEHVVRHILSLLPTKEAIKTSILSKRWRFLWTGISNLDFSDEDEVDRAYLSEDGNTLIDEGNRCGVNRKKFINYVTSVLLRLDPTYSLNKCSITLRVFPDVLQIKKWISRVAKHNVKDLSLYLGTYSRRQISVPRKVFGCKSLEALRLSTGPHLKIPKRGFVCFPNLKFLSLDRHACISGIPDKENSPCFPNLKTLHLKMVRYLGKNDCVMKLIRNCPNLEDLAIRRVLEHNVSNLDMRIPQLTTAFLCCGWYNTVCDGLNVRIEAPIKYLTISNWKPTHKILVRNPSSLIEAEISFSMYQRYDYQGEQGEELFKLFKTVGHAKCLKLPIEAADAIRSSGMKLPLLSNVTQLEVKLNYKDLCMLVCYLNSTINLQILAITRLKPFNTEEGENVPWTEFSHVPECLESSLKRVEIIGAFDFPGELDMIKNMLDSAKVLEILKIRPSCLNKKRDIKSLRQEIITFPRASAFCQIDI